MPNYNPFIHGTNSSLLAFLPHTDFKLMSPIDMLEDFSLAPFSGEIFLNGLSTPQKRCFPCFGKIEHRYYPLEKVILSYSKLSLAIPTVEDLRQKIDITLKSNLSNISEFIIMYARAQQWQVSGLEQLNIEDIFVKFNKVKKLYYALLCLGKYAEPNFALPFAEQDIYKVYNVMPNHFTYENISSLLENLELDLAHLYTNPDQASLEQLNQVFILKQGKYQTEYGIIEFDQDIQLFQLNYSLNNKASNNTKTMGYKPADLTYYFVKNAPTYQLNDVINFFYFKNGEDAGSNVFTNLAPHILANVTELEKRIHTLKQLINPNKKIVLTDAEKVLVQDSFPIILTAENHDIIKSIDPQDSEFRATRRLCIKSDINLIATDNEANKQTIQSWLKKHQIHKNVILFAELNSSYQHVPITIPKQPILFSFKPKLYSTNDFHAHTIEELSKSKLYGYFIT